MVKLLIFFHSLLKLFFFNYLPFSLQNFKFMKFSIFILFLLLNKSFYCSADDSTNNTLTNSTDSSGNGTTTGTVLPTTYNWWGNMSVTEPTQYIAADSTSTINTTTDNSGSDSNSSQDSSTNNSISSTD
ncbi:hypothetical protein Mgra_00005192, partial [Meloidogyne graminicola]